MSFFNGKLILSAAIAAVVVACSDGGGGLAGIGGSGYIATGSVSGFGSVIVNGVKFNTDSAVFEIEDSIGTQDSLSIGMVVQVDGSINADGVTGTATGIRYGDQLEGPVAAAAGVSVILENQDGNQKLFRVLGTNVVIDANETVFEGTGFDYSSIDLGNAVEISGYYDQNQQLRATYIERKALNFDASTPVEIEGVISNLQNTSFMVRNVNVNAASANLSDFENGLENAVLVEVKGTYDVATNTITASEVEAESISYTENEEISIEGYVTRYVSPSDFDINGIPVDASAATFEPASLMLMEGMKVEVEGQFVNNILVATEVESEEGESEVHAVVQTVDAPNSSFVVDADPSGAVQLITVQLDASSTLEDDVGENEPFLLSQLTTGNFVEVSGFQSAASTIAAIKVKRVELGKPNLIQGLATAATGDATLGGTITILGVTYGFDSATEFQDEDDVNISDTEINNLISSISSTTPVLLKIKDEDNDGIADEVDQE